MFCLFTQRQCPGNECLSVNCEFDVMMVRRSKALSGSFSTLVVVYVPVIKGRIVWADYVLFVLFKHFLSFRCPKSAKIDKKGTNIQLRFVGCFCTSFLCDLELNR